MWSRHNNNDSRSNYRRRLEKIAQMIRRKTLQFRLPSRDDISSRAESTQAKSPA
jgi:hypothetical protein